jgi:hypothetical protein
VTGSSSAAHTESGSLRHHCRVRPGRLDTATVEDAFTELVATLRGIVEQSTS